ncbi:hypothetical protein, partial [Xenorhabdus bovienii]|uniref:hypothetical protein n=1 Tax=Xenorhabdus bovienii TaxID=40576 RepID=UPI003DA2D910
LYDSYVRLPLPKLNNTILFSNKFNYQRVTNNDNILKQKIIIYITPFFNPKILYTLKFKLFLNKNIFSTNKNK